MTDPVAAMRELVQAFECRYVDARQAWPNREPWQRAFVEQDVVPFLTNLRAAIEILATDRDHLTASQPQGARPLQREMQVYLDSLTITDDNIGEIRRSLFMPFDTVWNGLVRDETSNREARPQKRDICRRCGHYRETHDAGHCAGWTPAYLTSCTCKEFTSALPLSQEPKESSRD